MTAFGDYTSSWAMNLVGDADGIEATGQTTVSASLEDIAGLSFSLSLPAAGKILAIMTVGVTRNTGTDTTAAYAVAINSVDGTEKQRIITAAGDPGSITVMGFATLGAGTWTVQGRHRRVSGSATVQTDIAQLIGIAAVT